MRITKRQLLRLIKESIEDSQNLSYFGEGIMLLSQTVDIDQMPEQHQIGWLEKNCDLSQLGYGGFRNVFALNNMPDLVVKVAYTYSSGYKGMGRKMNMSEVALFNQHPDVFPRVYAYDKKQGNWFVADRAKTIDSGEDLGRVAIKLYSSFSAVARDILSVDSSISQEGINSLLGDMFDDFLRVIPEGDADFDGQYVVDVFKDFSTWSPGYLESFDGSFEVLTDLLTDSAYVERFKMYFESDQKLLTFLSKAKSLGMNDLGPGNVGTDFGETRLLVLDYQA